MLGWIGRWAASKGMVAVPNLIGLLNTAAQTAITNSGLTFSSSSTTNTGDSGLANKVASQTPTAGTLADYESSVSFVYYTYVAPPFFPFFPPFFPPTFNPTPSFPFFPPTFIPTPSFPFFPPSFPFFPPSFPFFPPSFPFFPPTFPSLSTWYFCCGNGSSGSVSAANSGQAAIDASAYCTDLGSTGPSNGVSSTPQNCTPSPSFPFFPPTFPALTTYYWCCNDGSGYSGPAANAEAALSAAQVTCENIGSSVMPGGVYTTPQSCSPSPSFPFFPPTFPAAPSFPFFPPSFVSTPTVVNTTYGDCTAFSQCPGGGEQLVVREYSNGTFTYDYECCSYTPTPSFPFFPPTFPAAPSFPFFPPTFPAAPSFPFFPPTFPAAPSFPFFPPTFPAAPSFPFFPPSFVSQCPSCYIESNCPSLYCFCGGPCDYDCFC